MLSVAVIEGLKNGLGAQILRAVANHSSTICFYKDQRGPFALFLFVAFEVFSLSSKVRYENLPETN
jgi:hypothetical protein